MTSRYPRPGSPTGGRRQVDNSARSSTGALGYSAYDGPPSSYSRHRDVMTSPRSSGERVIPISTERYVNGERVSSTGPSRYDAYESRPRRTTLDADPARSGSSASPSYSRTVVHQPEYRTRTTAGGSSVYDGGSYVSSNSSGSTAPRREHTKKVYSVDEDKNLRLQDDTPTKGGQPRDRSHRSSAEYHLSGPRRPQNLDDKDAYEYTDARGMFRDTEPKWRPRQHSIDGGRRERPNSMIDSYPGASDPRRSARELGPPPTTRGFDKINASSTGVSRHGSISNGRQSPPRHHHRRNSADRHSDAYYSDQDDNYRVAPRISAADRGALMPYEPPSDRRDDRREPRHHGRRYEDAEVASRGFGIRAPSAEPPRAPRDDRDASLDRHGIYEPEPPRKALPAPKDVIPDYNPEPSRGYDRDPQRPRRESPPRERERREHDEPRRDEPRRDEPRREDPRRDDLRRERDYDRRELRRGDDDRRPTERRPERDYNDDRRERHRDEGSGHPAGNALAGAAAAGGAAYAASKFSDRHQEEERLSDRESRVSRESRDSAKQAAPGAPETRPDERTRPDDRSYTEERPRGLERPPTEQRERGRFVDESPEDIDRPRQRHYARRQDSDEVEATATAAAQHRSSEPVDAEEEYRRRVQQEAANTQLPEPRRREDGHESGSDVGKDGSMALTPYKSASDDSQFSDDANGEGFAEKRKRRVSIVEPAKAIVQPKSILRKPTEKFPEDPNPIREGVAPLKDAKNKDAPPTARWTKINRSMVNPEALDEAQERYEERQDHVIVLRVLTREEIQKFADRTKGIRESRYDKERRRDRHGDDHHKHDRDHDERDRHSDRERERDRDRERRHRDDRDRDRDREEKTPELADMISGLVSNVLESSTKHHR